MNTALADLERDNDDLGTPRFILDRVRSIDAIGLDPCSNPWSSVGATVSISRHAGQDGLALPWSSYVFTGLIFVNFPYSKPMPWCDRIVEAARDGEEIVVLSKLDPSTRWAMRLREQRSAQCDLYQRVSFEGGAHKAGMMSSTLTYFGTNPFKFCHAFADIGDARVCR